MARTLPRTLALALFLSLPPGVGASIAVQTATGGGYTDPTSLAAGLVTSAVVFLFVVAVSVGGEENLPEGPLDGGGGR